MKVLYPIKNRSVKQDHIESIYLILVTLIFSFVFQAHSQEYLCTDFPMEIGKTWQYTNQINSDTLRSAITDTATINGKLYYCFTPYNPDSKYSRYWLRYEPDQIYALNNDDSTGYTLFDFSAEIGQTWAIPPVYEPLNVALNQCDWGSSITRMDNIDTVFNPTRLFFNATHFAHLDHPCYDAGIGSTYFKNDYGIIYFSQVTEGEVLDWHLVLDPPDTVTFAGLYTLTANPCLTVPCLPGIVSAVKSSDTLYVLTKKDAMFWNGEFTWNEYAPTLDDSILATGIVTPRKDINRKQYYTIDLINFERYIHTGIDDLAQAQIPVITQLKQNYPNPFNPYTTIEYFLARPGIVKVKIYDIKGRTIFSQTEGFKNVGRYQIKFNAKDLPSGIYYFRLFADQTVLTRPMILLK
jgi:hypothetical protein